MPPLVKWHHKGIWLLRSDLRLVTLQIPGLLLLLSLKRENIWMHKRLKYQNTSYLPWVCLCILEKLKSFHIAVFFSVIGKIDPKGMPCELSTVKCVPQRSWKARDQWKRKLNNNLKISVNNFLQCKMVKNIFFSFEMLYRDNLKQQKALLYILIFLRSIVIGKILFS